MISGQNLHNSILLSHGGGGKMTRDLIRDHFLPNFHNPTLDQLNDSAILNIDNLNLAFTTDTFVVKPIFFPGGDIGHLSICGTVNDLAVMGAKPLSLSAAFVIEEGFSIQSLQKIIKSMHETAQRAGVSIVTGDTKVVEKGSADGIFINTSGIGIITPYMSSDPITDGDAIIISGPLGDHGIAVLSAREDLPITADIKSDAAPLNLLIMPLIERFPGRIKFMRDATRGGFATVLNEITDGSNLGALIKEELVPVNEPVRAICELLGFDPLYVANEGKVVIISKREEVNDVLNYIRTLPYGEGASLVGEITSDYPGKVILETKVGGGRIMDMLIGDQLPRIC
jgi:hydrogenase expression/formation protein HypE